MDDDGKSRGGGCGVGLGGGGSGGGGGVVVVVVVVVVRWAVMFFLGRRRRRRHIDRHRFSGGGFWGFQRSVSFGRSCGGNDELLGMMEVRLNRIG